MIAAGTLKGARYTDIGHDDLVKAAKSYRPDPRFQQFAKRWLSAKLVATEQEPDLSAKPSASVNGSKLLQFSKAWFPWTFVTSFIKGRALLCIFLAIGVTILMSRPLFYVVLGKLITNAIKFALRKSVGFAAVVIDAFLEEISWQLDHDVMLVDPPTQRLDGHEHSHTVAGNRPGYPPAPDSKDVGTYALHFLSIIVGAVLGRTYPRAQ